MKPRVFITRKLPEAGINLLKQHCQVKVYTEDRGIPRDELLNGVKWGDALLCLLTDSIDEEVMSANPKLRVIANYAVGFDNIDVKAATARSIAVTNTPEVLTDAVAEHTFALMLAIARRIPESDRFTRAGKYQGWEPLLLLGTELTGKTLGVIGLGRIGVGVAQRAAGGMGMNIIYNDTRRNLQFEETYQARFAEIDDLLRQADFITIHLPLLPSTRHFIGRKQLELMKSTAYLINTSRGAVIDERALVDALKKKKIAGAALDVYEFEPELSAGLAQLDNIVLTPHTASATYETRAAMSELAAGNILDVLRGKTPQNLVNKEVAGFLSKAPLLD